MVKTIHDALSGIKLYKYENIDVSKCMHLYSIVNEYESKTISSIFGEIRKIILVILTNSYQYVFELKNKSKLLFAYSHIFYRNDSLRKFKCLTDTINECDVVYPVKMEKSTLNLKDLFRILPLLFIWYFQLRSTKMKTNEKIFCLNYFVQIYKYMHNMKKLDMLKYSLLTVYFDASPMENALVQKFNLSGIKTATLQHGVFIAQREQRNSILDLYGIEFRCFISDYFLVWDKFTQCEALKSGIPREKIRIMGIPEYANYINRHLNTSNSNVFGVFLNHHSFFEQNKDMIIYSNMLARKYKQKYRVKYHPNSKGNEMDAYIDEELCIQKFILDSTVTEFISDIDFSIVMNSSVYSELMYLQSLNFRLSYKNDNEIYICIEGNTFSNFEELEELFKNMSISKKVMNDVYKKYSNVENITENYKCFFDTFTGVINE